jgi:cysteine desulfurase/selenocysteine lyase
MAGYKINNWRKEFPFAKNVVFLNHASFGPIPQVSLKKTYEFYDKVTLKNLEEFDVESFQLMGKLKKTCAPLIQARPEEIGFAYNTSYGLNIAAQGIELKPKDIVLLSDIEFPANVYPWLNLKNKGVKIKFMKSRNGFFDTDNFIRAIDKKTKVLALSFVQFFNGFKNDLEKIGRICKEKNIFFVVDGIQGVGNLEIDVKKCQIDFLACGGQKWLLSSMGGGFFYYSSKAKQKLETVFSGWLGVDWQTNWTDLLKYNLVPFKTAQKFDIGTYPFPILRTFYYSTMLLQKIGVKNIQKHNLSLLDKLILFLQENEFKILSSLEPKQRSSILSFACENGKGLFQKLRKEKILVSYREGGIRVSPHFYNNEEDMERLIKVLKSRKW